jgi:hypothetical protein
MLSIERSQEALKGEFSKVLATTAATSHAVEELKSMLTSCMGMWKNNDRASPSASNAMLGNPNTHPIPLIEAPGLLAESNPLPTSAADIPTEEDTSLVVNKHDVPMDSVTQDSTCVVQEDQGQEEKLLPSTAPTSTSLDPPDVKLDCTVQAVGANLNSANDLSISQNKGVVDVDSSNEDQSVVPAKEDSRVPEEDGGHRVPEMGDCAGDPYSLDLLQESVTHLDAAGPSPKPPPRIQPKRSTKAATEVKPFSSPSRGNGGRQKLLIFNVHGTLLDCSLRSETNPNSKIRPTLKTQRRRVVHRPWLQPFLSKCFLNFTVAFWGSKSKEYMDDVVPTLMEGRKVSHQFAPLFTWSGKDCEAVEFQGDTPVGWGKPLSKVYSKWPQFSPENTLIIDNNIARISCNPAGNVIISSPFYVAGLAKLADDNRYLELVLWPVMEAYLTVQDAKDFRLKSREILQRYASTCTGLTENQLTILRAIMLEGEGS